MSIEPLKALADELERLAKDGAPAPWGTTYGGGGWAEVLMIDAPHTEADVHLMIALRNNLPTIISALRKASIRLG